ncbi:hypothetical protein DFH11DRAFT_1296325 [Phellopilus nigrolimitatus]|nr:hypothetical protein DFH11DRAFT_1296325 [Phellopilus nigrolimitatus]
MPFNAPKVPEDIWSEIALFSGLKEVLALEATCKSFHNVVSNKAVWLKQLRALDQDHAPDLPRHISVDELDWLQVRTLVVRAYRRQLNCTGPAPLRPTREITVPIGSANLDGALGEPYGFRTDVQLLPGRALLLVLWSEGYLQCWDVPGGKCLWTYPDPASSGGHEQRVRGFCYDIQEDNIIHILTKLRNIEIFTRNKEARTALQVPRKTTNYLVRTGKICKIKWQHIRSRYGRQSFPDILEGAPLGRDHPKHHRRRRRDRELSHLHGQ